MIKLKECEDSHLGEEVDRNWNEVVTQQYLFDRLAREVGGPSVVLSNAKQNPHKFLLAAVLNAKLKSGDSKSTCYFR